MSGRITPAVRALEQAGATFRLLEYEYDSTADHIGLQAAQASPLDEIVVNGGRRGLQILVAPADLILAACAEVVALKS